MDKKAFIELVKSFIRFIWFGVLGLVVTFLTSLVADSSLNDTVVTIAGQTFKVGFVIIAGVGLLAKAIDRYIHKSDKIKLNGIAPV